MTEPRPERDPLVELHFALAEGHAQQPPQGIDDTMVRAALEARAAGRPVDEPAPIHPSPWRTVRLSAISSRAPNQIGGCGF